MRARLFNSRSRSVFTFPRLLVPSLVLGLTWLAGSVAAAQSCSSFEPPCYDQPPTVSISPLGGTYTSTPLNVTITFNDDIELNWSSVSISPSGFSVTQTTGTTGSATKSLTITTGGTTVTAWICDSNSQCDTTSVTYTYSEPPGPTSPNPPSLNLNTHNGENRDVSRCVASCFENALSHTTPSYRSLDADRSVTLVYWPPRVTQKNSVMIDVWGSWTTAPAQMRFKLKRTSWVSFEGISGGPQEVYFGSGNGSTRVGGRFSMSSDTTGAYTYKVAVGAVFTGIGVYEDSADIRVLYVDDRQSPYGAGWGVAGMQRLVKSGTGALLVDGDGSVRFFASSPSDSLGYSGALGDFSTLRRRAGTSIHDRWWPDSTRATFDSNGRLSVVRSRFGDSTRFTYTGTYSLDSIIDPIGKVTRFFYSSGKLDYIQDPGGRVTQITVNGSGDLTHIYDPDGVLALQVSYDGSHVPTYTIDRRGGQWDYWYGQSGKLDSLRYPTVTADGGSVNPMGRFRPIERMVLPDGSGIGTSGNPVPRPNPDSLRAKITAPAGDSTRFAFDRFEQPTRVEERDQQGKWQVTTRSYTSGGQIAYEYGPSGSSFAYYYDASSRLGQVTNLTTGARMDLEYESTYSQVDSVLINGQLTDQHFYGTLGRLDSTKVGSSRTKYTYDSRYRVLTVTDPQNHVTTYAYYSGDFQNTQLVAGPLGNGSVDTTSFEYDSYGRLKKTIDPAGYAREVVYDSLNRVRLAVGPIADTVRLGHNDSAGRDSVIDPIGLVYTSVSNDLGWVTQRIDPRGNAEQFAFDKNGNVTTYTNRRSQTIALTYDVLNRPITSVAGTDTTAFAYDSSARWVAVRNAESTDTVKTDADGRPLDIVTIRNGVRFVNRASYDVAGLRTTLKVIREGSGGWTKEIGFDTDAQLRFNWLKDFGAQATGVTYNADQLPDTIKLPVSIGGGNKLQQRMSYTSGHLVSDLTWTAHNDKLRRMYYYDVRNLDTTYQRYENQYTYRRRMTYDAAGRLSGYADYADWQEEQLICEDPLDWNTCHVEWIPHNDLIRSDSYSYDKVGNRTDHSAVWDATNKRLVKFDGDSLVYDADGNITKRRQSGTDVQRLYWDAMGQLLAVWTSGADSVTFGYDGFGRRVRKTKASGTTRYLWDGDDLVMELDGNGNAVREYAYYPGVDAPHSVKRSSDGTMFYYGTELPGHVSGVISSGNSLVNRYEYTPWGEMVTATEALTQPLRYGSREYDAETGFNYLRARYYLPKLGRFMSEDPIRLAGGLNPYSYARNDPVQARDPSGLDPYQEPKIYYCLDENGDIVVQLVPCETSGVTITPTWPEGWGDRTSGLNARPSSRGGNILRLGVGLSLAFFPGGLTALQSLPDADGRTPAQCFAENTAPVVQPAVGLAVGVVGAAGGTLAVMGRVAQVAGQQQIYAGTVEMDLFFGTRGAASSLLERGLANRAAGAQLAQRGAGARAFGTGVLAGGAALAAGYFGTSFALCAIYPAY